MTYRPPKVFLPKQEPPLKFRHRRKSGFQRTRQDDAGRIPLVARSWEGSDCKLQVKGSIGFRFRVLGLGVWGLGV